MKLTAEQRAYIRFARDTGLVAGDVDVHMQPNAPLGMCDWWPSDRHRMTHAFDRKLFRTVKTVAEQYGGGS